MSLRTDLDEALEIERARSLGRATGLTDLQLDTAEVLAGRLVDDGWMTFDVAFAAVINLVQLGSGVPALPRPPTMAELTALLRRRLIVAVFEPVARLVNWLSRSVVGDRRP